MKRPSKMTSIVSEIPNLCEPCGQFAPNEILKNYSAFGEYAPNCLMYEIFNKCTRLKNKLMNQLIKTPNLEYACMINVR